MESAKGKTREDVINRLADRIDTFEKYTQPHSRLMAALAAHLANRFGLATPDIDAITEAAMLHDIGLYTMSPAYHSLPRPLNSEARLDLWRHPVVGEQQMAKLDAMRHSQLLVRWHHEWWNGSGYPDMLAFEDIPIGARILRAVELYAALICDRPYRGALDEHQAAEALASSAGTECDPYVIKALLALLDDLRAGVAQPNAQIVETPPVETLPEPPTLNEQNILVESTPLLNASEPSSTIWAARSPVRADENNAESGPPARAWGEGLQAFVPTAAPPEQQASHPTQETRLGETSHTQPFIPKRQPSISLIESSLARSRSSDLAGSDSSQWLGWNGSRYNRKALLGFQASVLRQLEFRSIAIPFWGESRLDWYLKAWGKTIFANDPRGWAGIVARANVEAAEPLGEDTITRILQDVYIPGVRLWNPDLRRWFGESDAWWMDNLRRNIESLDDLLARAQAFELGLYTGDYALSFGEQTLDLRRPLTTVFWRLAGRAFAGPAGLPHNRSFNQPAEDFIRHARADLLYLRAPGSHTDRGGAEARSDWREAWISGPSHNEGSEAVKGATPIQSRQSYLASVDRLLRMASKFRIWAVEYQEPGLATAQDIIDLVKEYRPVKATYSKDVTEVVGGLRNYIIVGEKPNAK
ncbi:MAG TPA: HD domain-containing phosphohydrolase [Blastocatellia bacterium]|nr:HD domain-containing phosphohydrolase [Blastocatellia bacterium]